MHEETFSLCGFLEAEDSPTKLQEYNRSYWSKNSSKLNQAKRRNRQVKKEQELNGSGSPMFESVALPAKDEPQTVENGFASHSDNASLSDLRSDSSLVSEQRGEQILAEILRQLAETRKELENQNREKLELKGKLEACVAKILEFPDNKELAEANAKVQKTIAMQNELAAIKHRLQEILEWQNQNSKTTPPTTSSVTFTEKRNVSGIATANEESLKDRNGDNQGDCGFNKPTTHDSVENQELWAKKKSLRVNLDSDVDADSSDKDLSIKNSSLRKPLLTLSISFSIILFVCFNTWFLVSEQYSLNLALGYGVILAWVIAVLTEGSLVLLSTLGSYTSNLTWKIGLYAACAFMTWTTIGVISSSVDTRVEQSAATSDKINRLKSRLSSLQAQEATALAVIRGLDTDVYPTRIQRLSAKLEDGISAEIKVVSAEIDQLMSNHTSTKSAPLVQQRKMLLLCNLLLSAFLGFLWSGRSGCLVKKMCLKTKQLFLRI